MKWGLNQHIDESWLHCCPDSTFSSAKESSSTCLLWQSPSLGTRLASRNRISKHNSPAVPYPETSPLSSGSPLLQGGLVWGPLMWPELLVPSFSHPLGLLFKLLIGASAFHPWCLHLINLCLCLITWQALWNRGNHFKSQFCPWYMEEDQVTSGSDFLPVKWMAVLFWRVAEVAKSYASTQHKQKRVNIQTCHWGQEAFSTTFPTKQSWKQGFLVLRFPLCDRGVLISPWEWSSDNMLYSNFPGQACL